MKKKQAVIVCSMDAFANAVKPKRLSDYLKGRGYHVEIFATNYLSRWGESGPWVKLPGVHPLQLALFALEFVHFFAKKFHWTQLRTLILSAVTLPMMKLRGKLITRRLGQKTYDLMICENGMDEAMIMNKRIAKIQILDPHTPFGEELYYGGALTRRGYRCMVAFEKKIYERVDYLSFQWHTFNDYVKAHKYHGKNMINLGYGTLPKKIHAKFASPPRIVFLGLLEGYWINLPLLRKLCQLYPNLDVYGGPSDPGGVNYKGYAPTLDVFAEYQFGLVTISDDPIRRHSFSSKHLEYVSYGLPVLTPDWRSDKILDPASIHYNPDTFLDLIAEYSDQVKWEAKHKAALAVAKQISWKKAFKPLDKIV